MIGTKCERIFLADVSAKLVNNRKPIGVGVLTKADVCALARHVRQHIGKVFSSWLRLMLKMPISDCALDDDVTAESLEQWLTKHASGTMIRIQQHSKTPLANAFYIDNILDQIQMDRRGVGESIWFFSGMLVIGARSRSA